MVMETTEKKVEKSKRLRAVLAETENNIYIYRTLRLVKFTFIVLYV
jgi:hypothetical protein